MADGGDKTDDTHKSLNACHPHDPTCWVEFAVLQKGETISYTVPSFPVFTVLLRNVRLQCLRDYRNVYSIYAGVQAHW